MSSAQALYKCVTGLWRQNFWSTCTNAFCARFQIIEISNFGNGTLWAQRLFQQLLFALKQCDICYDSFIRRVGDAQTLLSATYPARRFPLSWADHSPGASTRYRASSTRGMTCSHPKASAGVMCRQLYYYLLPFTDNYDYHRQAK